MRTHFSHSPQFSRGALGNARQTTRSAMPGGSAAMAASRSNRVAGLGTWRTSTAAVEKSGSVCAWSRLRATRGASRLEALRIRVNLRAKRCAEAASAEPRLSSATNATSGASSQTLLRTAANVSPSSCAADARTGTTREFQLRVASIVGQRWPNVERASSIAAGRPGGCSRRWVSSMWRESTPPVKNIAVRSGLRRRGSRNPLEGSIAGDCRGGPYHSRSSATVRAIPSASRGRPGLRSRYAARRRASPAARRPRERRRAKPPCRRPRVPASASKRSTNGSRAESSHRMRAEARTIESPRSRTGFVIFTAGGSLPKKETPGRPVRM